MFVCLQQKQKSTIRIKIGDIVVENRQQNKKEQKTNQFTESRAKVNY